MYVLLTRRWRSSDVYGRVGALVYIEVIGMMCDLRMHQLADQEGWRLG